MLRVKICGITNLKDALDAIEAGASALGFVFYKKSKRYITPQDAKKIIKKLPPFIQCVGLFVNEDATAIDNICHTSMMDIAQIHFEATKEFYDKLKTKHIKVIRVKNKNDLLLYKDEYKLIDAFVESYGGEGKSINSDWFKDIDCSSMIIAGGLCVDNLDQLKQYNFYGFDVSSSVEIQKGKKSKQKMVDFIKKVDDLHR